MSLLEKRLTKNSHCAQNRTECRQPWQNCSNFYMNNPEQVAQSFLQAYYQAFVTNRAGISAFYVIINVMFCYFEIIILILAQSSVLFLFLLFSI